MNIKSIFTITVQKGIVHKVISELLSTQLLDTDIKFDLSLHTPLEEENKRRIILKKDTIEVESIKNDLKETIEILEKHIDVIDSVVLHEDYDAKEYTLLLKFSPISDRVFSAMKIKFSEEGLYKKVSLVKGIKDNINKEILTFHDLKVLLMPMLDILSMVMGYQVR